MSLSRTLPTIALLFATNACVGGNAPEDPYDLGAGSPEISAGGSRSLEGPVPEAGSRDSHFPLIDGARYTYRHTNLIDDPWEETQTIVGARHEGEDAFTLSDQEDAEGEQTHSTLVAQGTRVYRVYKEVEVSGTVVVQTSYDPPFLRYDEAWRTAGDSVTLDDDWAQTCVVASSADNCAPGAVKVGTTSHRYTVLAIDEELEVPAGRFTAVKIQRDNLSDPETKLFWFASGVGKLREENPTTGAVTELTAHDLP